MNSATPAASGRAGTGLQGIKAGGGNIFRPTLNRSRLGLLVRFLPLVILIACAASPAHANGVVGTIANGEIKYGTVTSTGYDTYSFTSNSAKDILVSVAETGTHDSHFLPQIYITNPPGGDGGHGYSIYRKTILTGGASGSWSVKVSRSDSTFSTGGTYAVSVVVMDGSAISITPPN